MKALIAMGCILMCGCTMYTVEKVSPDGSTTVVKIKSTRGFETPTLHYAREGQDAVFDFSAQSVDNNTDTIVAMFAPLIAGLVSGQIAPVKVN
jgi:hypothetical protein